MTDSSTWYKAGSIESWGDVGHTGVDIRVLTPHLSEDLENAILAGYKWKLMRYDSRKGKLVCFF